jgi:hypothetical protein
MLRQLESVGIYDDLAGNSYVSSHLESAYKSIGVVTENANVLRNSVLMGPNGGLGVESMWEGSRLLTVKLFGGF